MGSALMHGAEVIWKGQRNMEEPFQRGVNRMSRTALGALPSAPVAFFEAEGGRMLARAGPDQRQEGSTTRLCPPARHKRSYQTMSTPLAARLRVRGAIRERDHEIVIPPRLGEHASPKI